MVSRGILGANGAERVLSAAAISRFQSRFVGKLLWSDHNDYNATRKVWNGMVDKRPAAIAQCTQTSDIVECVRFARHHDLLISVRGGPIGARFTVGLSNFVGRIVIDRTGLTGYYDITLKWTPDGSATSDPSAPPDLFTALEEQLGLKLVATKAPVDVLVVDHVERPSEN